MTRVSKIAILFLLVAGMVLAASAGTLGGYAGSSASVSGDGMAIANSWDADYEAGFDLVVTADHPGASSSVSMTVNSQDGNDDIMVQVKANELKACAKVMGPSEGTGFAQAIASARALATGGVNGDASITQDGGLTLETWLFASTHTYAGDPGVTALASATASGTAKASGSTPDGSAMAESKGKVMASSSATVPSGVCGDSILNDGGSTAVSAAMIGAAAHAGEESLFAGYPSYMYTPISLFHPLDCFDELVHPYFYPGNGLATANMLDGTGYAKSTATGSATASADWPDDFVDLSSGCMPIDEPVVKTSSSGTVASGVAGTETMAGAISGINAWAFAPNLVEDEGAFQDEEEYLPTAMLDAGSTIFAAGGVIDESLGIGAVSGTSKKKPVTVDTATFSASGKSSGMITIEPEHQGALSASQLDLIIADLDASASGSISGKVTQDGGGASGSANAIAARALGLEVAPIDWGILLPSIQELNMIAWEMGAGEGMLYSMLGSASGSIQDDGTGSTSATLTGSAVASGEGRYPYPVPAYSDGGNGDDLIFPVPGISGQTSAKGTIKSSTNALPSGEAATTSQILATGGEGPLFGGIMVDYGDPELFMDFSSEVGGMAYLTTMDYAASEGMTTTVVSTSKKSAKIPTTSATSSVSGQADFEGSSVMVNDVGMIVPKISTSGKTADGWPIILVDGEDHQASASSKGTVTGKASVGNVGEADTGSLIFSASAAEFSAALDSEPLIEAVVDYSLIFSDSSAEGFVEFNSGGSASAKGTADGSTTATSSLEYTGFDLNEQVYQWSQVAESTTTAKGKMSTEATAAGWSSGQAVSTLKSYNGVEPAAYSVDFDPFPPFTQLSPAAINDDSVLASSADVWGKEGSAEKSSAMATLSGSTSSDGSHTLALEELILPDDLMGDSVPAEPPSPEWNEVFRESITGGTSVSNSDKVYASGQGSGQGNYDAEAFSFACADQMTVLAPDGGKVALAQGIFGTYAAADTTTHILEGVKSEAAISKVQVNAYADPPPPDVMAEIGIKGGKASAKVTSGGETSTPATYGSLIKMVSPKPPGGTADDGDNYAGGGEAWSWHGVIADSRIDPPVLGDPPTLEILHPVAFWS